MWLTDMQKYGVGLTAAGVFFFGLGLITFFDSALLAFGNVLFLSGILLIIGVRRTFYFFARPAKIRGSCLFFFGIVLILIKYSFIGFAIEFLGILSLFGDFFGVIVTFLRSLPVIGPLLSNPYIAPYLDRLGDLNVLPV